MSGRIIKGYPEEDWEDFAICRVTLESIRDICNPGTIIEFGSGVGTRRLAETFHVISFEHDPSWIIYHNHPKVEQFLAPLNNGWYYRSIVENVLAGLHPATVTGVLIDGPPHLIGREGILHNLETLRPFMNCPIFVDDTHREADLILASKLARELGRSVRSYDCNDEKKPGAKFSVVER